NRFLCVQNNAERQRRATERLRSPVVFSQEPAVRKTQLRSFSQYVEARPEVKRQRSVPEDLRRAGEERGLAPDTDAHKPYEDEMSAWRTVKPLHQPCSWPITGR
uniref:Uncharacterized protein n=1 Tax=Hucho hucho TaxID=62062 RepID=A0A4W5LXF9_9TELE